MIVNLNLDKFDIFLNLTFRVFLILLRRFISQGGDLVDQDTAEKRAACCVACPNNVPIKGCMGCSGAYSQAFKVG